MLINWHAQFSGKLRDRSWRYWHSTYYIGRVHSILGQNLNIPRHPHFGQFFAVHVRGHAILLKIEVIFFLNFFSRNLC